MELPILFFRGVRDSEGRPNVFARSNEVEEEKTGIVFSGGSEGECVMDGMMGGLRLGLSAGLSDNNEGFCWVWKTAAVSSGAAVLISGEECVR
jgi:hypothetical protein